MQRHDHPLLSPSLTTQRSISSFHFGTPGSGQKVYIQASLHADELPGMMTAWHLKQRLAALEAEGRIAGEIILVPVANPIGLDQNLNGVALGRFELASGQNFNRYYPAFAASCSNCCASNWARTRRPTPVWCVSTCAAWWPPSSRPASWRRSARR